MSLSLQTVKGPSRYAVPHFPQQGYQVYLGANADRLSVSTWASWDCAGFCFLCLSRQSVWCLCICLFGFSALFCFTLLCCFSLCVTANWFNSLCACLTVVSCAVFLDLSFASFVGSGVGIRLFVVNKDAWKYLWPLIGCRMLVIHHVKIVKAKDL